MVPSWLMEYKTPVQIWHHFDVFYIVKFYQFLLMLQETTDGIG